MSETNSNRVLAPTELDRLHRDLSTAIITFHEGVARLAGMSAAEQKCLGVIREMGAATPGDLARATGLSTAAVTGVVDRLEKAGYAAREPNPDDRRSVLIRAKNLEAHRRVVMPLFAGLTEAMATLQSHYAPEDLALIRRYLAETTAVLKDQTARLPARRKRTARAG